MQDCRTAIAYAPNHPGKTVLGKKSLEKQSLEKQSRATGARH
jgi:hypothetical protein